jgi:hypothetical protein
MTKFIAVLLLAAAFPVFAESLALPASANSSSPGTSELPAKGSLMSAVRARYGEPERTHTPVGGDAPRHPPITRWDYAGFSVFFENDHVVDSVRPNAPAPIATRDGLVGTP